MPGGDHALLALPRGADVDALALPAEQAEDLDGLVACGSETVRKLGAELSDFAGSRGCLLTLRLCLFARPVCYLWEASESPRMVGNVHLGGLVACGFRSPEMPRGVGTCYLSCFRR